MSDAELARFLRRLAEGGKPRTTAEERWLWEVAALLNRKPPPAACVACLLARCCREAAAKVECLR